MSPRTTPARIAAVSVAFAAAALVASYVPTASASPAEATSYRPGPIEIAPHPFSIGPLGRVASNNWAGYVDKAHVYSVVRSTWRQPKVTCGATDAIAAFWVGLDGYASTSVEQDGTLAYCHNGTPTYYTWWEMYPHNSVQLMHASVHPGDKVTSSVVRKGTSYTLKVVDHTHPGNSFTRGTACAICKNSSAEWITERVTGQGGLVPLAKFSHVVFFGDKVGVAAGHGPIGKFVHDSIVMVNGGGAVVASVSPLKKGGKKFVATWHRMQ